MTSLAKAVVHRQVVPPKSGAAIEVRSGQVLRVTDLEGQQVVDLVAWNLADHTEKSSTAYTRNRFFPSRDGPYAPKNSISVGDWIMSNVCRPMLTMVADTPPVKGIHGLHHRMCNRFFYAVFAGQWRDGCFEILQEAVRPYGLGPGDIPDSIDLFMNYPYDCDAGSFRIQEPVSRPGDFVELRAEQDCLVAVSNCPEDLVSPCNAYSCTPVELAVSAARHGEDAGIGDLSPDDWLALELRRRRRPPAAGTVE
jgi:uncharacterized protein